MSSTEPTTNLFGVAGPTQTASHFTQAVHTIATSFGTVEFVGRAFPAEGPSCPAPRVGGRGGVSGGLFFVAGGASARLGATGQADPLIGGGNE